MFSQQSFFYRMVRLPPPKPRVPPPKIPPPENPMLGEALAAVAQGTAAIMELLQNQAGQRGDRQTHTTLQQFLAIGPPRFSEAQDPLEADDWLAEIKKHFKANSVRKEDYVTFASFQLQGAAGSWYSTYKDNKGDTEITWDDFVKDFRAAHIPSGLMERKREEFLALGQEETERVQLVSSGAQEGQVLGSRSSAPGAAVSAEGGSCSHFCPPSCPSAARTSLYSTLREAACSTGPAQD